MGISSSKKKENVSANRSKNNTQNSKESGATITSSDKAKLQLKIQRDDLNAAIRKYERVENLEHEKAKEFMRAGNKRKALYCLKREKQQQEQISSITNILDNVDKLLNTLEFSEIEAEVVKSMKDGKNELQKLNKMLNVEDIEKLMDDTAESVDEAKRIDAILSTQLDNVHDDDELLQELQEQMGESGKVEEKDKTDVAGVKVPNHPLPEKKKEEKQEEDAKVENEKKLVAA